MKTVYVGMSADYLHVGHINLIDKARDYGDVIVGLLTDQAIASYKRVPITSYEQRKKVISNINGVTRVVPQYTLDYTDNLIKYKPDYVVHGDDWKKGIQSEIRQNVIDIISEWGGELIEPSYTEGISSTKLINNKLKNGITPNERRKALKNLLKYKPLVRVLESHNGLSGIIVEKTKIENDNNILEFDAIWESSLTDSASKGKPDIEIVDFTSRLQRVNEIIEVTTKPIIVDGDTGGTKENFVSMVKTLERIGVSAIIIEDKKYPKKNSLLDNTTHSQESVENFCEKIKLGINSKLTEDFMIIARIESLIANKGVEDALIRAKAYISAGADAIMIHSKNHIPTELIEFCNKYKNIKNRVPLVLVPSTYNHMYEEDLQKLGASIVIYANHLLRASYLSMKIVAESILINKRSFDVNNKCCTIKEIVELI